MEARSAAYSSSHSELQNSDVSEGKTEHGHGGGKSGGGGGARERRNGKVPKPALLHQNSTEVSSTNQVEVPDTTQNSPVSISSGLNSDPDVADSPALAGMGHAPSVLGGLSQSAAVFMSEVTSDPVYSMSPTGGAHLLSPDPASQGLVLGVGSDGHKFAFPGATAVDGGGGGSGEGLAILSAAGVGVGVGVSEELVLSSSLDSGGIKLPETTMNFDPDCFLNNPKQGQTYGGSRLKVEGGSSASGCSSSSCGGGMDRNGGLAGSPRLRESSYAFSSILVKNIKTEDTSYDQQLGKDCAYQVGSVVSNGGGVSGSNGTGSAQGSLTLTPTGSLLPSGGGLSPSTTLEQMDFSAINAKQEYSGSTTGSASGGYGQPITSPQLANHSCSPSFYLQEAPQSSQSQHSQPGGAHGSHESTSYLGLQVVKCDPPSSNGHHPHPHPQHRSSSCNGGSPAEVLRYQGGFSGLGAEHEEGGGAGVDPPGGVENGGEAGGHLQACGGGGAEGGGEHYLQQGADGGGGSGGGGGAGDGGGLHNGTASNRTGSGPSPQQQQIQPLLQGAGLVQGLYNAQGLGGANGGGAGGGASGGVEISLDHFDISFGNQFSDLINDFIAVDSGGGGGAAVGPGGALYAHQLVAAAPMSEGQPPPSEGAPQQGHEEAGAPAETGYSPSELCLQSCCSPQALGRTGVGGAGAGAAESGSLTYMQVAEVAQGTLGMIQATGRLFMVTDYSPEWSYPEVIHKTRSNCYKTCWTLLLCVLS